MERGIISKIVGNILYLHWLKKILVLTVWLLVQGIGLHGQDYIDPTLKPPPIYSPKVTKDTVCKGAVMTQFEVDVGDESKISYDNVTTNWEIYKTSAGKELVLKRSFSNKKTFAYANYGNGYWVRYQRSYEKSVGSHIVTLWSDLVKETTNVKSPYLPTFLETYAVDNNGNNLLTNLVCDGQIIKLVATIPVAEVEKHRFHWYRDGVHIATTDENEHIDAIQQTVPSQSTVYSVKTELEECASPASYSAAVQSATVFNFAAAVTAVDYDTYAPSCPDTQDGSITINSATGGTNLLYFNIAKVGPDGKLEMAILKYSLRQK